MQKTPLPSFVERVIEIAFVLIFLSFAIVLVIGSSVLRVNSRVKELNHYLLSAQSLRPNFEQSLQLYTENTEAAIGWVHSLRPESEMDYVEFISQVEEVGQRLGLEVDLESLSGDESKSERSSSIAYMVSFFGGQNDLTRFLTELEQLPYYVRVDEVKYKSIDSLNGPRDGAFPNISLTLRLYVK